MANKMTQLQQLRALAVRVQSSISAVAQAASNAVTAVDKKVDGKADNTENGANNLLAKLTTSWSAAPTDDTYFIRQDTGGTSTFGRLKFSTLWTYIKGKADSIYQAKGSYAASNHTHTKSQISDFPTSLPASDVSSWAKASSKPSYAWSEIQNKPSTFTPSSHTHSNIVTAGDTRSTATTPDDYSNSVTFKGLKNNTTIGSPSGDTYSYLIGLRGWSDSSGGNSHELAFNNTGVYWRNGAASWSGWSRLLTNLNYKDIVTPASIGAAASSHTHNYAGSSSAGGSATSAAKLDTASAGSATQPTYFSGGKPVACSYTLGKSVPSNAVFTDTNTWRGIQNNLTSDSTTDSLSAAQGKALKTLVDGKAASGHTHKSVLDNGNGTSATTFAYSKSGMNYGDYSWLAGWNGYELRAVSKSQFAQASHTHDDRYYTESEINTKLSGKSDTSHTHSAATTSAAGMMSAADKAKLDGIAAGANNYTLTSSKVISALGYTPASAATAAQMPYSITYEGMYTGTGASLASTPLAVTLSKVYDAVGFIRVAADFQKTTDTLQNMLLYALTTQYNSNYDQAFRSSFVPFRALSASYNNKQASVGYMVFEDTNNDVVIQPRRDGSTLYITASSGFSTKMNASGYRYFYFGLDLNSSIKGVVK